MDKDMRFYLPTILNQKLERGENHFVGWFKSPRQTGEGI
jgi:hypothetical protein